MTETRPCLDSGSSFCIFLKKVCWFMRANRRSIGGFDQDVPFPLNLDDEHSVAARHIAHLLTGKTVDGVGFLRGAGQAHRDDQDDKQVLHSAPLITAITVPC